MCTLDFMTSILTACILAAVFLFNFWFAARFLLNDHQITQVIYLAFKTFIWFYSVPDCSCIQVIQNKWNNNSVVVHIFCQILLIVFRWPNHCVLKINNEFDKSSLKVAPSERRMAAKLMHWKRTILKIHRISKLFLPISHWIDWVYNLASSFHFYLKIIYYILTILYLNLSKLQDFLTSLSSKTT